MLVIKSEAVRRRAVGCIAWLDRSGDNRWRSREAPEYQSAYRERNGEWDKIVDSKSGSRKEIRCQGKHQANANRAKRTPMKPKADGSERSAATYRARNIAPPGKRAEEQRQCPSCAIPSKGEQCTEGEQHQADECIYDAIFHDLTRPRSATAFGTAA
jgi:hypothetical protein